MKVSEAIIQNRNISEHTKDNFYATYKGKSIEITTNHGHGDPEHDHLTRYDIVVIDLKTGMFDVNTWEDYHNIHDAIRCALQGACLIEKS
jgi:GTP:adenosylcobinamide-phosphate guanylyltransferase